MVRSIYTKYHMQVTAASDGMPTWVCEMMVTKDSVEEAIEYITDLEARIEVPIQ